MGRPRKGVSKLKEVRADRHAERDKNFPIVAFDIETPSHYTEETKIEFLRQYSYQKDSGILSSSDVASLILAFNVHNEASKLYQRLLSLNMDDDKYPSTLKLYLSTVSSFNSLIKQFGATPTERTKVTELVVEKKEDKPTIVDALGDL